MRWAGEEEANCCSRLLSSFTKSNPIPSHLSLHLVETGRNTDFFFLNKELYSSLFVIKRKHLEVERRLGDYENLLLLQRAWGLIPSTA